MWTRPFEAARCLEELQIGHLAGRRARELSGGQIQRVMWARALTHQPKLLLLDEPSTGLDVHGKLQTQELVAQMKHLGIGVLLTTHDMGEARKLADRVVVIDDGRVAVEGEPAALVKAMALGDYVVTLDVELDGAAPGVDFPGLIGELEEASSVASLEARGGELKVWLFEDGRAFEYEIVRRLMETRIGVKSMMRSAVGLEEVFLRTVAR